MNHNTAEKLLQYCANHAHWSIFEMVNVVIEINTTRDIARQILRHGFKFQEFSQRYQTVNNLGYQLREARLQDPKNRQNSIEIDDKSSIINNEWKEKQQNVLDLVNEYYEWAIKNGIAKEQARSILPEGNTRSRMYANGTLRNWIHYCQVRTGNETQKEHREIAKQCWEKIVANFPELKNLI